MRSSRIRFAATITALVMVSAAALSGCGAGDASSDGKTTLTMWDPGLLAVGSDGKIDQKKSAIYQLIDTYEKQNPDITIKLTETSGDISKSADQFRAASMAKNGPDIRASFTGGNTTSFAQYLEPLDAVFPPSAQKELQGWQTVRTDFGSTGPIYGVPIGAGSYFYVFYRPSMFKKAGIDMTTPPTTWDQLIDIGKKLKAKGITPFYMANQEGYVGAWVVAALVGGELGPDAFSDMYSGKTKIDSPAMRESLEAFADLYKDGLTNPDAGSVSNGQAATGLIQGKGAMIINGSWSNQQLTQSLGDDVSYFPIPTLAGAKYPNALGGGPNVAVSVTKYSKHKKEAEDFVKFLAQPSSIDVYVKANQTEPSNATSGADPSVIENPLLKQQATELADRTTVYPFDNIMPQEVIDLLYRLDTSVLLGTTTPADATKQLQAAYDKAMAK